MVQPPVRSKVLAANMSAMVFLMVWCQTPNLAYGLGLTFPSPTTATGGWLSTAIWTLKFHGSTRNSGRSGRWRWCGVRPHGHISSTLRWKRPTNQHVVESSLVKIQTIQKMCELVMPKKTGKPGNCPLVGIKVCGQPKKRRKQLRSLRG